MQKSARLLMTMILMILFSPFVMAQIMSTQEVPLVPPQEQGGGQITPSFWIGAQAVESFGYNLETGAFGLRNHSGDTWASFNFAFVDSKYDTPKFVEYGGDQKTWTGRIRLQNYTYRLNSWTSTPEVNLPSWIAEIQGNGFHIGLFNQAGKFIEPSSATNNNPSPKLSSANMVLYFNNPNALDPDYIANVNPATSVSYTGTGLVYLGYTQKDVFKAYLSILSEGNVNSNINNGANDGWAGAVDLYLTPFGTRATKKQMLAPRISLNAVKGFNYNQNPLGIGTKAELSVYLGNTYELIPLAAFDGKWDETFTTFSWAAGGGLQFRFSNAMLVNDDWGELATTPSSEYFNYTYENSKILKYSYAQLYASYSEQNDIDIAVKIEEPDGAAGFDKNLGAMLEVRLNNIMQYNNTPLSWSAVGRISYELMNNTVIPYIRTYLDSKSVLKLRTGAQIGGIIPNTGFEIAYTSRNLNQGASSTATADKFDKGRIEFITIIKADSGRVLTPKRMSDLNY